MTDMAGPSETCSHVRCQYLNHLHVATLFCHTHCRPAYSPAEGFFPRLKQEGVINKEMRKNRANENVAFNFLT